MKKREFNAIKNKKVAELKKDLSGFRDKLRVLKFDLSAGKVKNVKEIKAIKKSIAQVLTLINGKT